MTRIAELQKKYPTIPLDVIVKWDVLNKGMGDCPDIDKASYWQLSSQGAYQNYEESRTLDRQKQDEPQRVKENASLIPGSLFMKSGLGFFIWRKDRSPYTIKALGRGKFALYEGEEKVDIDLYYAPLLVPREGVTSKGTPVSTLVETIRQCWRVMPVRFCEYFNSGDECQFCNFNPSQEQARAVGLNRPVAISVEDTGEAFKMIGSEMRLLEGILEPGGFKSGETHADVTSKFAEALTGAVPYSIDVKMVGEALTRGQLVRLKNSGVTGVWFQMEAFDERLFPVLVPGKAKRLPREGWLEAFQDAVDIFGVGSVGARFIGGLTMQGPQGYKDWQEARDSHIEGDKWMISHGILPSMGVLRWAPGSPLSKDPANREKYPPTELFLDLIVAHDKAMTESGLYDKVNRWLRCGLTAQTYPYCMDMGVIKREGDYGTWMSKVVDDENNWVRKFVNRVKQLDQGESNNKPE